MYYRSYGYYRPYYGGYGYCQPYYGGYYRGPAFYLAIRPVRSPSVAATGKPTAGREAPIPLIGGIEHCIRPGR